MRNRRRGWLRVIELREVQDSDLPIFWAQLSDTAAQEMAAVTRDYHYDRPAFDRHWAKVRSESAITVRTVVSGDTVVGHVAAFGPSAEREVTYWIDPSHWGKGIATEALLLLTRLEDVRPLHAHAVADNAGSIRVLEKCGFRVTSRSKGFARARGGEVDEIMLTLR